MSECLALHQLGRIFSFLALGDQCAGGPPSVFVSPRQLLTLSNSVGRRNKDLQPKIELSAEDKQLARQQFEKLTEAASSLMDSGELDIYSQKKVLNPPKAWKMCSLSPMTYGTPVETALRVACSSVFVMLYELLA